MQKINKKAMSAVITSVLIILISVVAVSILAATITKMIKPTTLSPNSCVNMKLSSPPPVSISQICYNQDSKTLIIDIAKNSDVDVNTMNFIANYDTQSEVWGCGCDSCQIIKQGDKRYYITTENMPNSLVLSINDCSLDEKPVDYC